jgi:hypothetical protein
VWNERLETGFNLCLTCPQLLLNNPTTTSIFDLSAVPCYAPPAYPAYHQEALYVTSLSDRRRRICFAHV